MLKMPLLYVEFHCSLLVSEQVGAYGLAKSEISFFGQVFLVA